MASVSSRARSVKQPRGGYLKPSQFKVVHNEDGKILNEDENVSGGVIGMAVDYLTRFMLGASAGEAFSISLSGASIAQKEFGIKGTIATANKFLNKITGIDDESIIMNTFYTRLNTPLTLFKNYTDGVLNASKIKKIVQS